MPEIIRQAQKYNQAQSQPNSYAGWASGNPVALPRPAQDFSDGGFGPGTPITSAPLDTATPGLDRPSPRRWQYPVWFNLPTQPGMEGTNLISFQQLIFYAQASTFVRACIDRRVEEILGLEWDIVPTKIAEKSMGNDQASRDDFEERRLKAINFFKRPDPDYDTFHNWLKVCLEDVFVIDALSLYLHPTRVPGKGLFGSNLASLEVIDGSTIKPLVDLSGSRPQPPNVAFQQYLWGVPRLDLMDVVIPSEVDEDDFGAMVREYRGDQLLYLPYHRTARNPYGLSPVAKSVVPIEIELRKQKYVLEYYREGNVPASFISIGNAESPTQVRQWQDALDAVVGDTAARHQVTILPTGSTINEMHTNAFNDSYDMTNKEEILAAFGLTAMEMGLLPGGKSSGLGGKGVSEQQQELQIRAATQPLLNYLKRNLFDYILQTVAGQADMQWYWHVNAEDDPKDQMDQLAAAINVGLRTRDEARVMMGLQPFGLPLTSFPTVPVSQGVVPLAGNGAVDPTDNGMDSEESPQDVDTADTPASNATDNPMPDPTNTPSGNAESPLHEATVPLSTVRQGDDGAAEPLKYATVDEIKSELEQLKAYLRHRKPIEKFSAVHVPTRIQDRIATNLHEGFTSAFAISDAVKVVDQDLSAMNTAAEVIAEEFNKYNDSQVDRNAFVQVAKTALSSAYETAMGLPDVALFDRVIADMPEKITHNACVDMLHTFAVELACDLTDKQTKKP